EEELDLGRRARRPGEQGDGECRRSGSNHACSVHACHGAFPPQPLTPENMKLSMNWRWKARKATTSGSATSSVPAASNPHSCPPSAPAAKLARPMASVRF